MIELQFFADGRTPLLEAIRQAAAEEGGAWSRRKVLAFLTAGQVRVEESVVRDPRALPGPGARVDLRVEPHATGLGAAGHAASSARLPLLHLDRHLIVVEVLPGCEADVEAALRQSLDDLGMRDVPAPLPFVTVPAGVPCTGLVAAALTDEAARQLQAAFRSGEAWLRIDTAPGRLGPGDVAALAARPPRPSPPHVVHLAFPHPRSGRRVDVDLAP